MEVYYNELSKSPNAPDAGTARDRIIGLLQTMKAARQQGVNVMRTHSMFYADELAEGYSFVNFLADENVSRAQREFLKTIARSPFIPDEDSMEAEWFVMNRFESEDHRGEPVSPEGLAAALIFESPTISISSHKFWTSRELLIKVIDGKESIEEKCIQNFWDEQSVSLWVEWRINEIPLNSEENIRKVYPSARYQFETRAMDELISWFHDDQRYQKRIKLLIDDIPKNPFSGGIGKTETLGGTGGMASKRIVGRDRLTYTYTEEKITIHSCRGHYDDH